MENNGKHKVEIEEAAPNLKGRGHKVMENNGFIAKIEELEELIRELQITVVNLDRKLEFICGINGLIGRGE